MNVFFWGCEYDDKNKKCSGTIFLCSEFIKTYCSESLKGNFDAETKICKGVPNIFKEGTTDIDMIELCLDGKFSEWGCEPNNLDKQLNFQYKPNIYLLKNNVASSDNSIYLSEVDLKEIEEEGGSVSVLIQIVNSGLPEGTPVSFSIFDIEDNPVRVGKETLNAIVDSSGDAKAEWLISKDDLVSLNPDTGHSRFVISFVANGVLTSLFVNSEIKVKTGECYGAASCENYPKDSCLIAQALDFGCSFDYSTGFCKGENKASCDLFEFRQDCKLSGCKWKADSLWERFFDWVANLFG